MAALDDLFSDTPADKAIEQAMRTESTPPVEPAAPDPPPEKPAVPDAPVAEPAVKAADAPPLAPPPAEKPAVRMVPQESLHEERQKRHALERELAELRRPAPEELDELKDPIGVISQLKGEINQFKAAQRQHAEEADLGMKVAARVNSYAKDNPDYIQQYQFLQMSRVNELRALGQDDASIARQIKAEEMDLGRIALAQDKNPGEIITALATARGWQKSGAAMTPPASPAPAAADPVREAEERVDRLERGRRAAQSSSGSGGGSPNSGGEMSIEQIVNLDGAAFDTAAKAFLNRERSAGR